MSEKQVVGASAPVAIRDAEAFIFDMDGVLYRGKQALPGVNEIIAALEVRDIPYLLATNNSTATPADYVRRMAGYGVTVTESHLQTSATATRDFLKRELPDGAIVLPIGAPALAEQLQMGTTFLITDDPEADVAAVVVGGDQAFTDGRLSRAM